MTGGCSQLAEHIRRQGCQVFLSAVPADRWDSAILCLGLADAEYAALPALGRGWLVLSTAPVLLAACTDVTGGWENLLRMIAGGCEGETAVLSEGWARAARGSEALALPVA